MNKAEFVEAVADNAELTKADAGRAVDAMVAAITKALKKGDTVTLVGFGTFHVGRRASRSGQEGTPARRFARSRSPASTRVRERSTFRSSAWVGWRPALTRSS